MPNLRFCAPAVFAAILFASPLAGQDFGFLVVHGIENGPAHVFIDGVVRDTLWATELTIELPTGPYSVEITRAGHSTFRDQVVVVAGDVVQLRPRLEAFRSLVLDGSKHFDYTNGDPGEDAATIRALHLDPLEATLLVNGERLGTTPMTLRVPVGEQLVSVGGTTFCLQLAGSDSVRLRVRAGKLDNLSGAELCEITMEMLARNPVPMLVSVDPQMLNRDEVSKALVRGYPRSLRDAGLGGTAQVYILIDEHGQVAHTLVGNTSGFSELDALAIEVAQTIRFRPAEFEGTPVPVWIDIPLTFSAR